MKREKILLIVESSLKGTKIRKYLEESGYEVDVFTTRGHLKDLPDNRMGVELIRRSGGGKGGWELKLDFEIIAHQRKRVEELRFLAKEGGYDEIVIATDPDREGEGIAYHVKEEIEASCCDFAEKTKKRITRMRFYAISRDEVLRAFRERGDINMGLVWSQFTRRAIDRIVGYLLSPVVSDVLGLKLSVGRVQSAALHILLESERQHEQQEDWFYLYGIFNPLHYTGLTYLFIGRGKDETTNDVGLFSLYESLFRRNNGIVPYRVKRVEKRMRRIAPPLPFTTGSLLASGVRMLGCPVERVMSLAQRLYEKGRITYVRTDSVRVSQEGLRLAEEEIRRMYGSEYLNLNDYEAYIQRGIVQDAHECIRPVDFEVTDMDMRDYDLDELRLLQNIKLRFLSSQMPPALVEECEVELEPVFNDERKRTYLAECKRNGFDENILTLVARGRKIYFDGWLKAYDEARMYQEEEICPENEYLFYLKEGMILPGLVKLGVERRSKGKRMREDELIRTLEKHGIGRPATYVTIVETLKKRKYVEYDEEMRLKVTGIGRLLGEYLEKKGCFVIDKNFTAEIEDSLAMISEGKVSKENIVMEIYRKTLEEVEKMKKDTKDGGMKQFYRDYRGKILQDGEMKIERRERGFDHRV